MKSGGKKPWVIKNVNNKDKCTCKTLCAYKKCSADTPSTPQVFPSLKDLMAFEMSLGVNVILLVFKIFVVSSFTLALCCVNSTLLKRD